MLTFAALTAGFKALGVAGVLGRARQALSGPLVAALAITVAAAIVVASVAYLVASARSDVRTGAQAQCNADKLSAELAQVRASEARLRAALLERERESNRLREAAAAAETELVKIDHELGDLRAKSLAAAGPRACVAADDPWLRHGRAASGAAAGGR